MNKVEDSKIVLQGFCRCVNVNTLIETIIVGKSSIQKVKIYCKFIGGINQERRIC